MIELQMELSFKQLILITIYRLVFTLEEILKGVKGFNLEVKVVKTKFCF